jgi:ribose/xylose/arabinose/galactoside ABC-type transport system permease subunit
METTGEAQKAKRVRIGNHSNLSWFSQQNILLFITIVFFVLFSVIAQGFFTWDNFFFILRSMSIITVLGLGTTFLLTAGEIDLSIATVPALCAATFAILLQNGLSLPISIIIALVVAVVTGLINGLVVVKAGIPSIIVTLATYMIAEGFAYIITKQNPIIVGNQTFLDLFNGEVFNIPVIVLWMILFTAISLFILHSTKFGANVAFIGENRTAAHYTGIKVDVILIGLFIICAIFSFLGAMLGVAQASNATPNMITNDMMTAIAAPLIGGTSLAGGKGSIFGTLIGAFFLSMLSNGLLIFGIQAWVLYLINGIIIISVLSWSYLTRKPGR